MKYHYIMAHKKSRPEDGRKKGIYVNFHVVYLINNYYCIMGQESFCCYGNYVLHGKKGL